MPLNSKGAIALGYANIYVTAPSPENLRTLFEFVFKGLDAAGYQVCVRCVYCVVLWVSLLPCCSSRFYQCTSSSSTQ
jgi:hypothetical protein